MSEGEQGARPRRGGRAPAAVRGSEQAEASSDESLGAARTACTIRATEASPCAAL